MVAVTSCENALLVADRRRCRCRRRRSSEPLIVRQALKMLARIVNTMVNNVRSRENKETTCFLSITPG